ncbi:MAG: DUF302 domain-containing protein, partial [Armatimonadetes bacterium]|nr:DUF302 domain-containing protein [Armatimonadota bacterium]
EKTREALTSQGFGVITEIDVKKTMKEKLDEDFRPYIILGACNPSLAHRALSVEPEIGLLLPCNVCVWDNEDGTSTVAAIDVEVLFQIVQRPELMAVAEAVSAKLHRVMEALKD